MSNRNVALPRFSHRLVALAAMLPLAYLPVPTHAQTPAAPAASPFAQTADGVTLTLPTGTLRLQVCALGVIHVTFSPDGKFPPQRVPTVIARYAPVPFRLTTTPQNLTLATSAMQARVDRQTGVVAFLDAKGRAVLSEAAGRALTPTTLPGPTPEATYKSRQDFALAPDERIYGLGQHQDSQGAAGAYRRADYRGTSVALQQNYISDLAIPFLVSSRGYGVLWNNPSPTVVNVGAEAGEPIPAAQLRTADGTPGGLTGQYYAGAKFERLVATRTDADINFDWTRTPPPGLAHDQYSVRWTGTVQAGAAGDYTFSAAADDGVRLWIDDKPVVDDWSVHALRTDAAKVHFDAGTRHAIRLEYYQDFRDAIVHLTWQPPTNASEVVSWKSEAADAIDYYYFYGPTLDQVIAEYRQATGPAPLPPLWALGFWQSKERYASQAEWLDIAKGFRERGIPIDGFVQDWFYWDPYPWGSHQFDPKRYPDPAAGIKALHDDYHLHFMISVWGKFNAGSPANPDANYDALDAKGFLYPKLGGSERFYDAFNPAARDLYWRLMHDQIFTKGVDAWWLDAAEPEVDLKQFRQQPTALGLGARVMNAWPLMHTTAVHDGQRRDAPDKRVFLLTRSAFAGEQRNAATIWSSDIVGTWDTFAHQVTVGLDMALSGIPYWTTDTGGFFVNYPGGSQNPEYRELFTRWFEWSTFCPIFRVHGTSTPKEPWRFGPDIEPILLKYDNLRYRLLPYLYSQAWQVTSQGATIMRPLVMDFPQDPAACDSSDEFLFGPSILVCPVTQKGAATRSVLLPAGTKWTDFWTGKTVAGGQTISAVAPLDTLPLYVRAGAIVPLESKRQYVAEKTADPTDPTELRVYPGANGTFTLYEDAGTDNGYEKGQYATIPLNWNDASRTLTIGARQGSFPGMQANRTFRVVRVGPQKGVGVDSAPTADQIVTYTGKAIRVKE